MSDGAEAIRVCVRVRPMSQDETDEGYKEAVEVPGGGNSLVVHQRAAQPMPFTFDAIYTTSYTQAAIFQREVQPLCEKVIEGYNCTVFAYGQTGSGKTFTMSGDPSVPELKGMMPHAIDFIFHRLATLAQAPTFEYRVAVSYLELYMDKPRDLLADKQQTLEIHLNTAKDFYVKGLTDEPVRDTASCLALFDKGNAVRQTAATQMNEHSSRSHSVFAVTIETRDTSLDPEDPRIMRSKLNLVDLAGSERQSKTKAAGDTLKEGCSINASLSALGTVIDSIVKGSGHIPYRGNPLTQLLKDSLGGRSKTVMFANCGPANKNAAETISTLRFADNAKKIKNKPVKQIDPKDAKIQALMEEVAKLKARLKGDGIAFENDEAIIARNAELEAEMGRVTAEARRQLEDRDQEIRDTTAALKDMTAEVEKADARARTAEDDVRAASDRVATEKEVNTDLKRLIGMFASDALTPDALSAALAPAGGADDEVDAMMAPSLDDFAAWSVSNCRAMLDACKSAMSGGGKAQLEASERATRAATAEAEAEMQTLRAQITALQHGVDAAEAECAAATERLAEAEAASAAAQRSLESVKSKAVKEVSKLKKELAAVTERLSASENALSSTSASLERMNDQADQRARQMREEARAEVEAELVEMKRQAEQSAHDVATLTESNRELASTLQSRRRVRIAGGADNAGGSGRSGTPVPSSYPAEDDDEEELPPEAVLEVREQLRLHVQLNKLQVAQQVTLRGLLDRWRDLSGAMGAIGSVGAAQAREVSEQKELLEKELTRTKKRFAKEWEENVARFEAKKKEMAAAFHELSEMHEELENDADGLRKAVRMAAEELNELRSKKDREIARVVAELEAAKDREKAFRVKIADAEALEKVNHGLKQQLARSEATLAEKIATIENVRSSQRWAEARFFQEQQRVAEKDAEAATTAKQHSDELRNLVATRDRAEHLIVQRFQKDIEELTAAHEAAILRERDVQTEQHARLRKFKRLRERSKQDFDAKCVELQQLSDILAETKGAALSMMAERDALNVRVAQMEQALSCVPGASGYSHIPPLARTAAAGPRAPPHRLPS